MTQLIKCGTSDDNETKAKFLTGVLLSSEMTDNFYFNLTLLTQALKTKQNGILKWINSLNCDPFKEITRFLAIGTLQGANMKKLSESHKHLERLKRVRPSNQSAH
ncbi:CLUMA_CG015628, isoform A [Clunio marinus]|uniref:CLUMA_CG015628, isoform A n=1 Tax=Clunio marinus TaxID=568069 RepID=A0A1J1IPL3_9DIPT|nr:CLUMA_CG015628, isoform A [Clunio marinus]